MAAECPISGSQLSKKYSGDEHAAFGLDHPRPLTAIGALQHHLAVLGQRRRDLDRRWNSRWAARPARWRSRQRFQRRVIIPVIRVANHHLQADRFVEQPFQQAHDVAFQARLHPIAGVGVEGADGEHSLLITQRAQRLHPGLELRPRHLHPQLAQHHLPGFLEIRRLKLGQLSLRDRVHAAILLHYNSALVCEKQEGIRLMPIYAPAPGSGGPENPPPVENLPGGYLPNG